MTPPQDVFGFGGELMPTRLEGRSVIVAIRRDLSEIARRRRYRLGPILDRDLLRALESLPLNSSVRWADIDPMTAAVLDVAPTGVVESTALTVTRRVSPAVDLRGVLLSDTNWKRGLERASIFAPDAPRGLLVQTQPKRLDEVIDQATRLGIGVALPSGRLIGFCSRRYVRFGPRRWRVLETLYRHWLDTHDQRNDEAV